MGVVLPVLFALLAAFSNALATVLQRRAALSVPQSRGFRPGLVLDLLRRPVWLGGMLAVVVAGVGQAVALATGPLSLVQPLFVLELPLALLLASLLTGNRLPEVLWLAVGGVVVGLGVALASAAPGAARPKCPWTAGSRPSWPVPGRPCCWPQRASDAPSARPVPVASARPRRCATR